MPDFNSAPVLADWSCPASRSFRQNRGILEAAIIRGRKSSTTNSQGASDAHTAMLKRTKVQKRTTRTGKLSYADILLYLERQLAEQAMPPFGGE